MHSFFLADIEVIDSEMYQAYVEKASEIVKSYGGVYIFRTASILPITGEWKPQRLILIQFNSTADMHRCFESEEYRSIKHLREQSTKSRAILIQDDGNANQAMDRDEE